MHTPTTVAPPDVLPTVFRSADNVERLDGGTAFAEVDRIDTLGHLPEKVLTATQHSYAGLPADVNTDLVRVWNAGQERWASLSTDATLVPVADTGHNIQIDQPDVVVDQIRALLGNL